MSDDDATPADAGAVPMKAEDFPTSGPNSLATIGARALARMIDTILVSIPLLVIISDYVVIEDEQPTFDDIPLGVVALVLAIPAVYEIVLLTLRGATLGKSAMGIRVAAMSDGSNPSASAAAIRYLLPAVFFAIPLPFVGMIALLVWFSAAWNPIRRGWHDLAGGTVVVRSR